MGIRILDGKEALMKAVSIVALDTHCATTEIGVMTACGRMTRRERCPTTIPDLVEKIKKVSRPREVILEEGPLADWIGRELKEYVDRITICDPRRNHLIAKDSDKDDPIDVEKLAQLYRGGYIKAVHHPDSLERVVFKRHVALYHDSVRQRVRLANRLGAEFRHYGVFLSESQFAEATKRRELLERLPKHAVIRSDLQCLFKSYDAMVERVTTMKRSLVQMSKKEPQIVRFHALPGIKWIRASTFFAYVDTPWRFKSKSALWKYLGIGLERWKSGAGPERVRLPRQVNHSLKSMILGAAKHALSLERVGNRFGEEPFCRPVPEVAGWRIDAPPGPPQRGSKPSGGDVGHVEKWRRLPARGGRCGGEGARRGRGAVDEGSLGFAWAAESHGWH